MRKYICAIALITVFATMFSACTLKREKSTDDESASSVPSSEVITDMVHNGEDSDTTKKVTTGENEEVSMVESIDSEPSKPEEKTEDTTKPTEKSKGEAYVTDVGNSTLTLRKDASINSAKLDSIPNNTELLINKINGEWGYTQYKNKTGWVNMNYVIKKQDAGKTKSVANQQTKKGDFTFSTTDLYGDPVSYSDFDDAKLILVNFWEPWCGPCVGEMPDLEELYEKYKDDGLVILGVYYSFGYDYDAKEVVEDKGITYPILRGNGQFQKYTTEYVPTTILVDKNGNVITSEPYIGSNSYSGWERIIKENLYK